MSHHLPPVHEDDDKDYDDRKPPAAKDYNDDRKPASKDENDVHVYDLDDNDVCDLDNEAAKDNDDNWKPAAKDEDDCKPAAEPVAEPVAEPATEPEVDDYVYIMEENNKLSLKHNDNKNQELLIMRMLIKSFNITSKS